MPAGAHVRTPALLGSLGRRGLPPREQSTNVARPRSGATATAPRGLRGTVAETASDDGAFVVVAPPMSETHVRHNVLATLPPRHRPTIRVALRLAELRANAVLIEAAALGRISTLDWYGFGMGQP